jgi:PTS system mannose-specific IIB component/fructoselysine and glucoselysine-specific PTS system IIB component
VSIELFRIDDRLIHGQVVVGWGQPLEIGFIVLVDDAVAASDWEQDLYRMGVPAEMDVFFETVESAAVKLADYLADERPGILLTADIGTMRRLADASGRVETVNVGGLHHRPGRIERIRYIFLSPEEEQELRDLAAGGIAITAQDVPSAEPLSLEPLLASRGES